MQCSLIVVALTLLMGVFAAETPILSCAERGFLDGLTCSQCDLLESHVTGAEGAALMSECRECCSESDLSIDAAQHPASGIVKASRARLEMDQRYMMVNHELNDFVQNNARKFGRKLAVRMAEGVAPTLVMVRVSSSIVSGIPRYSSFHAHI